MSWSVLAYVEGAPTSVCFSKSSPVKFYIGFALGDIYQVDWSFMQTLDPSSVMDKLSLEARIPDVCCNAIAVDSSGSLLVTDPRHHAVLRVTGSTSYMHYISCFENYPLVGPLNVCCDSSTGSIAFTDSGLPGETGLHRPTGSLFVLSEKGNLLSLCHKTLASPGSLCFDRAGARLYVIEAGQNRILRFHQQRSSSAWEGRVFLQLAGSSDPVAIVCAHDGHLMIAFNSADGAATIKLFNDDGVHLANLPEYPGKLISSLTLSPDGDCLIAVDQSSHQLFTYRLAN